MIVVQFYAVIKIVIYEMSLLNSHICRRGLQNHLFNSTLNHYSA